MSENKRAPLEITLDVGMLQAAILFSAKKDIRYYLNGVCFWFGAHGELGLAASDGHRLAHIDTGMKFADAAKLRPIIPIDAIERMKPSAKNGKICAVTFSGKSPTGDLTDFSITYGGSTISGKLVEGKFPDVDRVLPSETNGEYAEYQPEYLLAAKKALLYMGEKYEGIYPNGDGAGVVVAPKHIQMIVMPIRMTHPLKYKR